MKTLVISPIRPLVEIRPLKVLSPHHRARLVRVGTWVQKSYADKTELVGLALVGTFDRWAFGVREVHHLDADGPPYRYCGMIPASEQNLEVYVESAAPVEIGERIVAFMKEMDREGRPVVLKMDDDGVRALEIAVMWRWRLWRWLRRGIV